MSRAVRTFDVLAAISTLLLCLVLSKWADPMHLLIFDGSDIKVFATFQGTKPELVIYGMDNLDQQPNGLEIYSGSC